MKVLLVIFGVLICLLACKDNRKDESISKEDVKAVTPTIIPKFENEDEDFIKVIWCDIKEHVNKPHEYFVSKIIRDSLTGNVTIFMTPIEAIATGRFIETKDEVISYRYRQIVLTFTGQGKFLGRFMSQ